MAKKERQKRSARQARQQERARVEAQQAAAAKNADSDAKDKKASKAKAKDGEKSKASKAVSNKPVKVDKPKKKGRIRTYLSDVRAELKRVTWPGRSELVNYSVATIATLIVVGIVVWVVDLGFVNLFNVFVGLRAVIGNG